MPQFNEENIKEALIGLSATVAGMVGYIEEQIICSSEGFSENNPLKITQVKGHVQQVKKLSNETIQRILEIVIAFRPKGPDAKLVISSWRIASSLERIAIVIHHNIHEIQSMNVNSIGHFKTILQNLIDLMLKQTYDLVIAYTRYNLDLSDNIKKNSQVMTRIYESFIKDSVRLFNEHSDIQEDIYRMIKISKNIELTGLYFTEIADQLHYKNNL